MKTFMKIALPALGLALAFGASAASALTQVTPLAPIVQPASIGQWTVVVTTVTTKAPFNTLGVCIVGDGIWYNTVQASGSTPGSGRWLPDGGNILWRGDMYPNLEDAAVLKLASPNSMSGYLMQWVKNTTDTTNTAIENVYGKSTWTYLGPKCLGKF